MNQKTREKFKGSYNIVFVMMWGGIALVIISIIENGIKQNIVQGALLWILFLVFMSLISFFTSVTVTDNRRLICKKPLEFSGFDIDIFDITKIDRKSEFIFKSMGSRLQIYHTNNSGGEDWHTIREANYNVETIKELIKLLKDINHSIKLHPQYQDLIDGKIDADNSFKSEEIEGKMN